MLEKFVDLDAIFLNSLHTVKQKEATFDLNWLSIGGHSEAPIVDLAY